MPPEEAVGADIGVAGFVLFGLLFLMAFRQLLQVREQRKRGEAELAASRVAPDDDDDDDEDEVDEEDGGDSFEVVIDLGDEGEHAVRIAKAGLKSAKAVRAAVAKAAERRLGQRPTLSITLTHRAKGGAVQHTRLKDSTPIDHILSATGMLAEPM